MKRAGDSDVPLRDFLKSYEYQPQLTAELDGLGRQPFPRKWSMKSFCGR